MERHPAPDVRPSWQKLLFTVWRLEDLQRRDVECTISERGGRWQLVVRRGRQLFLAERWPSDDVALARADEIWAVLVAQGWQEPRRGEADRCDGAGGGRCDAD